MQILQRRGRNPEAATYLVFDSLVARALQSLRRMDTEIAQPTPKPEDEERSLVLRHLADDAVLRAVPNGDERCANCLFYVNPDDEISYCWHPKLRILVGGQWWCQWWEALPDS